MYDHLRPRARFYTHLPTRSNQPLTQNPSRLPLPNLGHEFSATLGLSKCKRLRSHPPYNPLSYNCITLFDLQFHIRPNGSCPYDEYLTGVFQSGSKKDAAKISATVERLRECGSAALTKVSRAEKMNDVWQLRVGAHRVFYFWNILANRYVMLNGFRKKSPKTPHRELQKAEALRFEHLDGGGK